MTGMGQFTFPEDRFGETQRRAQEASMARKGCGSGLSFARNPTVNLECAHERVGVGAGLPVRFAFHLPLVAPDLTLPSMALPFTRPVYCAPPALKLI